MKYFIFTATMVLVMCLFFSSAQAQSSYTVKDMGITFNYPEGWDVKYKEGFVWITKSPDDDTSPCISIEILKLDKDPNLNETMSPEVFRDTMLKYYAEGSEKIKVESKSYDEKAKVAYARTKYNRKYDFTGLGAFLVKNKMGFSLSYEAPSTAFDETQAKKSLDMIINSLTFSK